MTQDEILKIHGTGTTLALVRQERDSPDIIIPETHDIVLMELVQSGLTDR